MTKKHPLLTKYGAKISWQVYPSDCVVSVRAEVTLTKDGITREVFNCGVSRGEFVRTFNISPSQTSEAVELIKRRVMLQIEAWLKRLDSLSSAT